MRQLRNRQVDWSKTLFAPARRSGFEQVRRLFVAYAFMLTAALAHAQAPPQPPVFTAVDGDLVGDNAATHDFTGLPLTPNGWHDLHAMIMSPGYSDARIVYVSNAGNDSTAVTYSPGSSALGGRPLDPSGSVATFRTLAAAYARLRPGFPDVMLLRRGDSWNESIDVSRAGRTANERLIIGAYGSESTSRPSVGLISTNFGTQHVILSSFVMNFSGSGGGVDYRGSSILLEDLRWNVPISGQGTDLYQVLLPMLQSGNGVVRRSTAEWTQWFAGWSDAQVPGNQSRVEENTLSRTPLNNLGFGQVHNVYFAERAFGIQSIGNQSFESGGAGWRQRGGGLVQGNLLAGLSPGYDGSFGGGFDVHQNFDLRFNVTMHVGLSLSIVAMRDSVIDNNVFVIKDAAFGLGPFARQYNNEPAGHRGTNVFSNNVVYGHHPNATAFSFGSDALNDLTSGSTFTIRDNTFMRNGDSQVMAAVLDSRVTYSGNRYQSNAPQSNWFGGQPYSQMIPATGTAAGPEVFSDAGRDMFSYMQSLGANPTDWQQALEWYQRGVPGNPSLAGALHNRRGAWDTRFTARAVINHVRGGFDLDLY